LKNMNRPVWLSYIIVFTIIVFFWTILAAAAASDVVPQTIQKSPVPGLLHPGNTTFGITIGAIVLVTIVITSAILRRREGS
jgi:hypothetical protein